MGKNFCAGNRFRKWANRTFPILTLTIVLLLALGSVQGFSAASDVEGKPYHVRKPSPRVDPQALVTVIGSWDAGTPWISEKSLDCPDDMVALNGGVESEGSFLLLASSPIVSGVTMKDLADGSHPAPTGWYFRVLGNGGEPAIAKAAVICAEFDNIGTHIFSTTTVGLSGEVIGPCPAGEAAIGGGIDPLVSDENFRIVASMPWNITSDADSWYGAMWYSAGGTIEKSFKIGAICQPVSDLRLAMTSEYIPSWTTGESILACQDGEILLGGGVYVDSSYAGGFLQYESPIFPGPTYLLDMSDGIHEAPAAWRTVVVNISTSTLFHATGVLCESKNLLVFLPLINR